MGGPVVSFSGTIPKRRWRHGVNLVVFAILSAVVLLAAEREGASAEEVDHYGVMVDRRASLEECVACHDGSIAKAAVYCLKDCTVMAPHSVMRPYPPPGRESAYRPVGSLREEGIELVDGMVVCISCHNLGNPPPYHLAVGTAASKLCLSCHIQ